MKQLTSLGFVALTAALSLFVTACTKTPDPTNSTSEKQLQFQFAFDSTQVRLGSLGQPVSVPSGNGAQSPKFRTAAVHYIELAQDSLTWVGTGALLYRGDEVTTGGTAAIDFSKISVAAANQIFKTIKFKDIPKGTYKWIRVSAAYQNFDIKYNVINTGLTAPYNQFLNQTGTVGAFIGFNSYIQTFKPLNYTFSVNANKGQGFGGLESTINTGLPAPYNQVQIQNTWEGQTGFTTVVNPARLAIGVPLGSCLISAKLDKPLVVTGDETADVLTTLSFSTNKSFEWIDRNGNGKLDVDKTTPANSDQVIDMGLRGLKVTTR